MKIFGMGGLEIVIILVVILLIFGPKNLPKLGSALGKTVSNLRAGMNEGKKKKKDEDKAEGEGEGEPAADEVPDKQPAALEGEVAEVAEDAEPDQSAPVEGGEPRKVKRVVKKKVVTDTQSTPE